jgi:hypothetical protein
VRLDALITLLSRLPPDGVVSNGFDWPMSYRGVYKDLAFSPKPHARVGDMLGHARYALGNVFDGYKGGRFIMDASTECWIAQWGRTVDAPISPSDAQEWERETNVTAPPDGADGARATDSEAAR